MDGLEDDPASEFLKFNIDIYPKIAMFERRYASQLGHHFRYCIYVKFLGVYTFWIIQVTGSWPPQSLSIGHLAPHSSCFTRCFREVATGQLELGGLSIFWGPVIFKRPLLLNFFGCKHFLVVEMEGRTSVVETKQSLTEFQNRNTECRENWEDFRMAPKS